MYIVGTPIGNLSDFSPRGVETLKKVAIIAAEDTRQTKKLCQHYGIATPLISFYEHNERTRSPEIIERLKAGESIALVTDAGMPVVSDPGAFLIEEVHKAGIPVRVIPGPSAVISALAASGFRGERFRFEGFPPKKSAAMRRWLSRMAQEEIPVICFESPYRLIKTLGAIKGLLGEIPVVVARELTKLHEEVTRGSTSEVLARYTERPPKGECTIVFLPKGT